MPRSLLVFGVGVLWHTRGDEDLLAPHGRSGTAETRQGSLPKVTLFSSEFEGIVSRLRNAISIGATPLWPFLGRNNTMESKKHNEEQ